MPPPPTRREPGERPKHQRLERGVPVERIPSGHAREEGIVFREEGGRVVQVGGRPVEHVPDRVERHELLGTALVRAEARDLIPGDQPQDDRGGHGRDQLRDPGSQLAVAHSSLRGRSFIAGE
jgi:hypothetical protein